MASQRRKFLTRLAERKLLARWTDLADRADRMAASELRGLQQQLRPLATELSRFDRAATTRLNGRSDAIRKPRGTDWAYRPRLWRERLAKPGQSFVTSPAALDGESTLFHDCDLAEITLRQEKTRSTEALSPYDMRMEVMHFHGSFLSLSIDLPDSVLEGLDSQHLIEVAADLKVDRPSMIYMRLNLRHDQNSKEILRNMPQDALAQPVTFDLSYADIQPRMVDKIWLDVIFPDPAMNLYSLSDLTLTRRPRAEF